jgi:hypothetical protein
MHIKRTADHTSNRTNKHDTEPGRQIGDHADSGTNHLLLDIRLRKHIDVEVFGFVVAERIALVNEIYKLTVGIARQFSSHTP